MENKIISSIVLYNPERGIVENIRRIKSISNKVIVVVNQCDEEIINDISVINDVEIIKNEENVGLSKALNIGINRAIKLNADYIGLFDQDSIPLGEFFFSDMIDVLKKIPNIASIGPAIKDNKGKEIGVNEENSEIFLETIITSGSLTPVKVFKEVGLMDEHLFIDYIDYEWCLRAISKGYKICQTSKSILQHNMGDVFVKFLWMKKPYHKNKIRQYYIIRNQLIMMNRDYISFKWKVKHFVKLLYRLPMYIFLSDDKITSLNYMKKAFKNFFNNRSVYKKYVY